MPALTEPAADVVAAVGPANADGRADRPALGRRRWRLGRRRRLLVLTAMLLVASAALTFRIIDGGSGYDYLGLLRAVGYDVGHLRWQFASVVIVLAGAHYLASAAAARAAAGLPLPLTEVVSVQLAAAAANRVTPAGLGGAAVTVRYFGKRGMPTASAIGAVIALNVLHGLADLAVMGLLLVFGGWIGLSGGAHEVEQLTSKMSGNLDVLHSIWTPVTTVAVAVTGLWLFRGRIASRVRCGCARFWSPITQLLRRPTALLTVIGASGATSLVLAFAFALSVHMVPGSHPSAGLGQLVIGFMLASAASNAVPTPAGVGATETALVSVLLASAVAIAPAVEVVIIYRVITFWLPPLLGLLVTGRLRRRGVL